MMGTKRSALEEPNVPNAIQAKVRVTAGNQAAPSTKLSRPATTAGDPLRMPLPDAAGKGLGRSSRTVAEARQVGGGGASRGGHARLAGRRGVCAEAGIRLRVQYVQSVTAYPQPTSAPERAALLRRN
jgi:hypothetical protein